MIAQKRLVRLTALGVGLAYTVVLFLSGIQLNTVSKQLLALIPAVAALLLVAFDKWVWKWIWVQKFHQRPHVAGLWRAALKPSADSHIPLDGSRGTIRAFVVIEQSFWTLSVTQFTNESRSFSRTSTFIRYGDSNQTSLSFLYDNVPRQEHRWRSPRHLGACEFSTPQGDPYRLEGHYFTDRFTQGEMKLEFIDRSTNFADFASASDHAAKRPTGGKRDHGES